MNRQTRWRRSRAPVRAAREATRPQASRVRGTRGARLVARDARAWTPPRRSTRARAARNRGGPVLRRLRGRGGRPRVPPRRSRAPARRRRARRGVRAPRTRWWVRRYGKTRREGRETRETSHDAVREDVKRAGSRHHPPRRLRRRATTAEAGVPAAAASPTPTARPCSARVSARTPWSARARVGAARSSAAADPPPGAARARPRRRRAAPGRNRTWARTPGCTRTPR